MMEDKAAAKQQAAAAAESPAAVDVGETSNDALPALMMKAKSMTRGMDHGGKSSNSLVHHGVQQGGVQQGGGQLEHMLSDMKKELAQLKKSMAAITKANNIIISESEEEEDEVRAKFLAARSRRLSHAGEPSFSKPSMDGQQEDLSAPVRKLGKLPSVSNRASGARRLNPVQQRSLQKRVSVVERHRSPSSSDGGARPASPARSSALMARDSPREEATFIRNSAEHPSDVSPSPPRPALQPMRHSSLEANTADEEGPNALSSTLRRIRDGVQQQGDSPPQALETQPDAALRTSLKTRFAE